VPIKRFIWTFHAEDRLLERGLTRAQVERAVRELHPLRETNAGDAQWQIDAGRFVVVYDHPAGRDIDAVRIVSAWSKRRRRRRHLRGLS
jgi:uncharacterized protein YjiS (DUF1127 family)